MEQEDAQGSTYGIEPVATPHDKFVRAMMGQKKIAISFFEHYLPEALTNQLALEELSVCETNFITKTFGSLACDVLCKTPVKGSDTEAYIYLNLEHQSSNDTSMAFRMWEYGMQIMSKCCRKTREKPYPLVIPVVLYHGKRRFHCAQSLTELIDAPESLIKQFLGALQPFHLINTHDLGDTLRDATAAHLMVHWLKHVFDKDFLPALDASMPTVREILSAFNGHECGVFFDAVINYLARVANIGAEDFIDVFEQGLKGQPEEAIFMSVYEQLQKKFDSERGLILRQKGQAEGREKERQAIALKMLHSGMSHQDIIKISGLPANEVQKLDVETHH